MQNSFKFKKGDLVYLPSNIIIVQMSSIALEGEHHISKTITTEAPTNVILLDNHNFTRNPFKCEILFNSQRWFARPNDLYSV